MKLSAGRLTGVAWEGSGLRLGILLDTNLYLAIVKPAYKVSRARAHVTSSQHSQFFSGHIAAKRSSTRIVTSTHAMK